VLERGCMRIRRVPGAVNPHLPRLLEEAEMLV
jgi:hypothetical protein